MSKKCIKCGQPLPDNASFCPHCTAVQKEKQEIKAPKRWRKAAFGAAAVVVFLAAVGAAFSLHHRPKSYEGGALRCLQRRHHCFGRYQYGCPHH